MILYLFIIVIINTAHSYSGFVDLVIMIFHVMFSSNWELYYFWLIQYIFNCLLRYCSLDPHAADTANTPPHHIIVAENALVIKGDNNLSRAQFSNKRWQYVLK